MRAESTLLHAADASDRLALLLGQVVRRAVEALPDNERVSNGVALTRRLIDVMAEVEKDLTAERPLAEGRVLTSISPIRPDGMAFIRRSGIQPLLEALARHCADGRVLRVLTTTYTGSTEAEALDMLRKAGADVRVSYDTTTTRLHAKAWLFDPDLVRVPKTNRDYFDGE